MPSPWKHPATGMYWLRLDVPKPLQAIVGKTSIRKTLGTKDGAEAKRLFPLALAAAQAEIDKARGVVAAAPLRAADDIVTGWFVRRGEAFGSLDDAVGHEGMLLTVRDTEAAAAVAWRTARRSRRTASTGG